LDHVVGNGFFRGMPQRFRRIGGNLRIRDLFRSGASVLAIRPRNPIIFDWDSDMLFLVSSWLILKLDGTVSSESTG
jgi:hypothetical protein